MNKKLNPVATAPGTVPYINSVATALGTVP